MTYICIAQYETSIFSQQLGETPIHIVAREGLLALAQTLCAFGCSVDVSNKAGLYPLHLAAKHGHTELVR